DRVEPISARARQQGLRGLARVTRVPRTAHAVHSCRDGWIGEHYLHLVLLPLGAKHAASPQLEVTIVTPRPIPANAITADAGIRLRTTGGKNLDPQAALQGRVPQSVHDDQMSDWDRERGHVLVRQDVS